MQSFYIIIVFLSLFSINEGSLSIKPTLANCLRDLITQELENGHNYLQLSSKFGTTKAFPGFSSMFIKLSDEDTSKAHHLVKFIALRKVKLDRLINENGIKLRDGLTAVSDIRQSLTLAHHQNKITWEKVKECHEQAQTDNDANVQDYLEGHLLEHHVEIDKLITDFEHRIDMAQLSEKKLIIYMLDEELLNTYGDRRKDIFS